jgi:DNA-directed RNA polymerase subunit L
MDTGLRVVSKEKDSITLEMVKYDNTILRPIVEELLRDDQVEDSKYYIKHPVIDNPVIYVKVKTGKPQAAVKRAIKKLSKIYESMSADLTKEKKKLEEKR